MENKNSKQKLISDLERVIKECESMTKCDGIKMSLQEAKSTLGLIQPPPLAEGEIAYRRVLVKERLPKEGVEVFCLSSYSRPMRARIVLNEQKAPTWDSNDWLTENSDNPLIDETIEYWLEPIQLPKQPERFKMPAGKELVEFAILFGKQGNRVDEGKLVDMVGMCLLILQRLHENGDVTVPCEREKKEGILAQE